MRSYLHTGQTQVRPCTGPSLRSNTTDRTAGKPLLQEVAGGQGQHEAGLGAGGVQAVLQAGKGPVGHRAGFPCTSVAAPEGGIEASLQAGSSQGTRKCADQVAASCRGHSARQLSCEEICQACKGLMLMGVVGSGQVGSSNSTLSARLTYGSCTGWQLMPVECWHAHGAQAVPHVT